MSTVQERRQNTRVPFETKIDLSSGDTIFAGCHTGDLSTKGVFIFGITEVEIGDLCDLTLHLIGGRNIKLEIKGVIQRITNTGVGVHFTETDLDSFAHLKNIIYYNSENPDIINESY